jgi:hypothetical protein
MIKVLATDQDIPKELFESDGSGNAGATRLPDYAFYAVAFCYS